MYDGSENGSDRYTCTYIDTYQLCDTQYQQISTSSKLSFTINGTFWKTHTYVAVIYDEWLTFEQWNGADKRKGQHKYVNYNVYLLNNKGSITLLL